MRYLVRLFRRETASTDFIPVIDGLRFLAIITVALHHVHGYISTKSALGQQTEWPSWIHSIFVNGNQGVQLFFAISGFILAYPFIRFASGLSDRKPTLKQYFVRRLTRLEPPYVVSTILIFFFLIFFVPGKYSLSELIQSLIASLFYVNNLVWPGEFARINSVTWSLEIEVQYYILAPVFIWALWKIKGKTPRRLLQLGLIVALSCISWAIESYWQIRVLTLASFAQYFFAGILLCDIVQLDNKDRFRALKGIAGAVVGLGLLIFLVVVGHALSPNLALKILSPLAIFGFYLVVFYNDLWRKVFSFNVLTLIGGMCYSIYLLHTTVISAVGRFTTPRFGTLPPMAYSLVQIAILLAAILIVSAAFFLVIEKPCMKRDWHKRLWNRLTGSGQPSKLS